MTFEELKSYAIEVHYCELSDEDCQDIIDTSYPNESVAHAVNDYLRAYGK